MFNTLIIKNIDSVDHSISGKILTPDEEYQVPDTQRLAVSSNSDILSKISENKLTVGNGSTFFTLLSDKLSWLLSNTHTTTMSPFASKTIGSKKLFTRVHGIDFALASGSNNVDFVVPYNEAKFTALEIVNGTVGDLVSLKILDTAAGLISGVPYYTLNQFGFSLRLPNGFYVRESQYDADLIGGMTIRLEFTTQDPRTVGINIILHEMKT